MEFQQLCVNLPFHTARKRVNIARKQEEPTYQVWPLQHLVAHSKDLPEWMIAEEVLFSAVIKSRFPRGAFRLSHWPMMVEKLVTERFRLPALQASSSHCYPIEPATFNWRVASNLLKSLSPE